AGAGGWGSAAGELTHPESRIGHLDLRSRARPLPQHLIQREHLRNSSSLSSHTANMVLGKVAHYAFDAVLISAFLAGVRRSTGLTPSVKSENFTETPGLKKWIDNYLWVGEWTMDQSVAVFGTSGYFERKR
ncbi:duf1748 domain containing protein, partial [Paraphaeosphaeria minitans]